MTQQLWWQWCHCNSSSAMVTVVSIWQCHYDSNPAWQWCHCDSSSAMVTVLSVYMCHYDSVTMTVMSLWQWWQQHHHDSGVPKRMLRLRQRNSTDERCPTMWTTWVPGGVRAYHCQADLLASLSTLLCSLFHVQITWQQLSRDCITTTSCLLIYKIPKLFQNNAFCLFKPIYKWAQDTLWQKENPLLNTKMKVQDLGAFLTL